MRYNKTATLILAGILTLGTGSAMAEIFGRSYVTAGYQNSKFTSQDIPFDDNLDMFATGFRLGGAEHLDAVAGFQMGSQDGSTLFMANAGLQPYWQPEEGFYKVFADVRFLYGQVDASNSSNSEDEYGFYAGLGSELTIIEEKLSFIAKIAYENVFWDDIEVSGALNYWATDWLLLDTSVTYALQEENPSFYLGAGVGF